MSRLIESIKIKNGCALNLDFHIQRMQNSLSDLFNSTINIGKGDFLDGLNPEMESTYKLRVLYNQDGMTRELIPYHFRQITSIKLVDADHVNYNYKFENRVDIDALYNQREDCDDILVVKQGLITDSSYCNVAFYKNGVWHTPLNPLLEGTKRALLIEKNILEPTDIHLRALSSFDKISLFNAMIEFEEIILPIDSIYK